MSRTLMPLNLTASLWKPIAAWIRAVNQRRMLADMPDYLLADIGLRRDQIAAAFDGNLVHDEPCAPAVPQQSAEVIAMASAKAEKAAERPEKPMAA